MPKLKCNSVLAFHYIPRYCGNKCLLNLHETSCWCLLQCHWPTIVITHNNTVFEPSRLSNSCTLLWQKTATDRAVHAANNSFLRQNWCAKKHPVISELQKCYMCRLIFKKKKNNTRKHICLSRCRSTQNAATTLEAEIVDTAQLQRCECCRMFCHIRKNSKMYVTATITGDIIKDFQAGLPKHCISYAICNMFIKSCLNLVGIWVPYCKNIVSVMLLSVAWMPTKVGSSHTKRLSGCNASFSWQQCMLLGYLLHHSHRYRILPWQA